MRRGPLHFDSLEYAPHHRGNAILTRTLTLTLTQALHFDSLEYAPNNRGNVIRSSTQELTGANPVRTRISVSSLLHAVPLARSGRDPLRRLGAA